MTHSLSPWRIERCQRDELMCWRIRSATAELLVTEQGAQVLSYQRYEEPPLIWLSEQAAFKKGQAIRGGVPICWPWFGDLSRNPSPIQALHRHPTQAPFHGLVRTLAWQLEQISGEGESLTLHFSLPVHELPDWPHTVNPRLEIRLDEALTLSLISHNSGTQTIPLTQALHTYLALSDIRQVTLHGLEDCRYIETLEGWSERQQQGPLRFTGETDRIYQQVPHQLRLHDPLWGRQLCLETEGSQSAIVWNPWIDKASRLTQFAPDAWQRMLCIETANVLEDRVELSPNAQTRLSVRLWTEPLDLN